MSSENNTSRGKSVPSKVKWVRLGLRLCGLVVPALAARWVHHLWFRTRRFDEPRREADWRQGAVETVLAHDGGQVHLYRWGGEGPMVLLVHGWNGRGLQLGALVAPLRERGFQVLSLDLPGHGRSSGERTNAFVCTELVLRLARELGPFYGIIGHSFGALVAVMAVAGGLKTQGLVTIAAPAQLSWLLDNYYRALQLRPAVIRAFEARVAREFGGDYRQKASALTLAEAISTPTLVVHDRDDQDVPVAQSEALHQVLARGELLTTEGLKHRRILRDSRVIGHIADFLSRQG